MDITSAIQSSAGTIEKELQWLSAMIEAAIDQYFNTGNQLGVASPPLLDQDTSSYAAIVQQFKMNEAERLLLILALTPHVRPQLLDTFFIKNTNYDRGFTEFGGIKGVHHAGFIPTGETFAFIISSMNLARRLTITQLFSKQHFFSCYNILRFNHAGADEPLLSASIHVSPEYLSLLTTGEDYQPEYSTGFPAALLRTPLQWNDLVLPSAILQQLEEIIHWVQKEEELLQHASISKFIRKGYRSLFYGPPGTGKTLTATLIGQQTGQDVYRIDLSMIVSKYIGETEKNLAQLFNMAGNKNWILFFDEADALFGKRSQTKDAHDRYANQEISYLLQRIEEHPGTVLLATNLKSNVDAAFMRRFHSIIQFPLPGIAEKTRLWQTLFSNTFVYDSAIDFNKLAEEHAITGGMLVNVLRYCAGCAMQNNNTIMLENIHEGIHREMRKEGKIIQ
ncbi:MAG: ATP-binding protein [Chitinophagaceae bacterium]